MIPSHFDYHAPSSVKDTVRLLAADPPGSLILGGGTWIVPAMSAGECRPRTVIDLARAGLAEITVVGGELTIGAMATYADLLRSREVARHAPLLLRAAETITGGWSIRNQGTIGGALAAARPQSDLPGALVACGAAAVLEGPHGVRRVPVAELIVGAMRTTLAPDEVLTAVSIPELTTAGVGYVKLKRGASSWPIATASALVIDGAEGGREVRVVLGAASERPILIELAGALAGGADTPPLASVAQRAAEAVTAPWDDALAPGEYRAAVAGPLARRAVEMALNEAGAR